MLTSARALSDSAHLVASRERLSTSPRLPSMSHQWEGMTKWPSFSFRFRVRYQLRRCDGRRQSGVPRRRASKH